MLMEANNNDLSLKGNNLTWHNRYAAAIWIWHLTRQKVTKGLRVTHDEGKNVWFLKSN